MHESQAPALYEQTAQRLADQIANGTLRAGDRLPAIRQLSRQWGVSITTVTQAYRNLENQGLVSARPQSGFYVEAAATPRFKAPPTSSPPLQPCDVRVIDFIERMLKSTANPNLLQLGALLPHPDLMPYRRLAQSMSTAVRRNFNRAASYDFEYGVPALRTEIARRMLSQGCLLSPEDIMITNGVTEGVWLALHVLCKPGDTVAVESPAFFGTFQLLERLGLRALEIPTSPTEGLSLEALGFALKHHRPKAVIAVPNFSNPLAYRMSELRKRALVELLTQHDTPLIEDNIYGELSFDGHHTKACKAFDTAGLVIHCSSFSKSLAPGYRIGWTCAGRYQAAMKHLKYVSNLATSTPPQLGIAEFLAQGGYEHHLRRLRGRLKAQMEWLVQAVESSFPEGTMLVRPQGGMLLWVQLPASPDPVRLYNRALEAGMSIAPGMLFSAGGHANNGLRLNAGWCKDQPAKAIATLGRIIREEIEPSNGKP